MIVPLPMFVKVSHNTWFRLALPRLGNFIVLVFPILVCPGCSSEPPGASQDEILPIVAPFDMPQLKRPTIPNVQYDIRDFGAREGESHMNTKAIQGAIDHAANAGGGLVVIPEGRWLTGAIRLENNIDLHLQRDAELVFSQNPNDYLPVVFSRHEDIECYKYSSFIYANGKSNIAITGNGTLNGQGKPWWSYKERKKDAEVLLNKMAKEGIPVSQRVFDGRNGRQLRPAFFQPMKCRNVLVEGVTFLYGAFWTVTPTYCENVIVRRVHIVTEGPYGHTPNGDGIDPSSCQNVLIEHCEFDTGDDCIALKAGRDNDGLRVGVPTEKVVIRNCRGLRGHGGIVIGSETSGCIRYIYGVNCEFKGTDRIVRIKTARGRGGVVENLWFESLTGQEIAQEAIHLNMLYTGERLPAQPISNATPMIRNVHFKYITCSSGKGYAIELLGLPERAIANVTFESIVATTARGINCSDVSGIRIRNASITAVTMPLMTITDGEDISIDSLTVPAEITQLLRVEGAKSRDIRVRSGAVSKLEKLISSGPEVSRGAIKIQE